MDTGGAIQLFTIRNAVNFLLGVGWGGVCFYSSIHQPTLLAIVAIICGCLLVGAFLLMMRSRRICLPRYIVVLPLPFRDAFCADAAAAGK